MKQNVHIINVSNETGVVTTDYTYFLKIREYYKHYFTKLYYKVDYTDERDTFLKRHELTNLIGK